MRVIVLNVALCLSFVCSSEAVGDYSGTNCRNGFCQNGRKCSGNSTCEAGSDHLSDEAISFLASSRRFPAHLGIVLSQPLYTQHLLTSNVSLSLRTFESSSLIFYAHDGRGNFLQLEVREGQIACKYNFLFYVFDFILPHRVNDGRWHHFRMDNRTFYVDNNSFINPGPRGEQALSSLTLPYILRRNENVRPLPKNSMSQSSNEQSISISIGGLDRDMGTLPPFIGCLSALKFGPMKVDIQQSINAKFPRIVYGCEAGCDPDICLNNGVCKEEWQRSFTCDCRWSKFSGSRCNLDVGRYLDGTGGFMLLLPSATAMSTAEGKLVLNTAPRVGDVILHLQRAYLNVLLFASAEYELSMILQIQGFVNNTYGRVDVSYADMQFPLMVRFTLLNADRLVSLQINDKIAELSRFWRRKRVFIDRVIVGDAEAARRIAFGGLNSSELQHFYGCIHNLQIFFENLQEPLELLLNGGIRFGKEELNFTRLTSGNISFCPAMGTPSTSTVVPTVILLQNATNSIYNYTTESVKRASPAGSTSLFWTIVLLVCGLMALSFCILGIIYVCYVCEKRSMRKQHDKRTYRKVSSLTPESLLNSTGPDASHTVTIDGSNNSSIRHDFPDYKVPYKPAYIATSLVLRDGKHMAIPESDPDLGESGMHHLV